MDMMIYQQYDGYCEYCSQYYFIEKVENLGLPCIEGYASPIVQEYPKYIKSCCGRTIEFEKEG